MATVKPVALVMPYQHFLCSSKSRKVLRMLKMCSSSFFLTASQFPPFSIQDSINEETVELLMPYLEMEDYTMENAKKVCGDVAGLASWTRAMAFFYGINKEVLPLKVMRMPSFLSDLVHAVKFWQYSRRPHSFPKTSPSLPNNTYT